MKQQTKLVHCGSTIFVYDFHSRGNKTKELGLEQGVNGSITHMKRLLLTNFVDDRLLATFRLRIPLNEYEQAQERLNLFVKHLKKTYSHRHIKYLAVTETSFDKHQEYAFIHLIADIEIDKLTIALNGDIFEETEEDYFKNLWKDELCISVFSSEELLDTFISVYTKSLTSKILRQYPKSFHAALKQPLVLWNEEAELFIKNHNLINDAQHLSDEIYDELAGFVNVNEYSLSNTSSSTRDFNIFSSWN
ncbi:hypothetical protein M3175_17165 [Robertmurraya korlensis]|uniref:hypothetical protein n=1 Tax=Robertmurraya korlensis TaxID=519977 RepID=UPI00203BB9A1|nr:hypothetical protein [Robertmurraya korlensis]MCM3602466.1 hypothetical protein [Robertmurraya korlensis]